MDITLDDILDEDILESAYTWLCQRRRNYPDRADIWSFRRHWRREMAHLRRELLEGSYRLGLLSRQNRLRLPAELIRDSSLAVSGLLFPAIGGRSVRPPQPEVVTGLMHLNFTWEESQGRDRYRRGLYVHRQRSMPYSLLQNFDAPEFTVTLCRRERSNTPLQALNLLNDPVFFEAAQALAVRILRDVSGSFDDRLDHAFRLCLSRPPYPSEQQPMSQYFARKLKLLDEGSAESLFPIDLEGESRIEAAAWVGLSSILLNLDEFITRE